MPTEAMKGSKESMKDCIQGPAQGHSHSGVKDKATYLSVHQKVMTLAEKRTFEKTSPQKAYINHSRWVVQCECNGAGLTGRDIPIACCFDCGAVYLNIVFPGEAEQIESALMDRQSLPSRNWSAGESLALLIEENKKHGVNDGLDSA